jgi:hypothetical protein
MLLMMTVAIAVAQIILLMVYFQMAIVIVLAM